MNFTRTVERAFAAASRQVLTIARLELPTPGDALSIVEWMSLRPASHVGDDVRPEHPAALFSVVGGDALRIYAAADQESIAKFPDTGRD